MEKSAEGIVGGPLSPLLSNILLDDLDKELEKRGHRFCRYADDCNIYVRSKAAGERVLKSLKNFLAKRLRLKVNEAKSQVARPFQRKFLGYSVTVHRKPRLKVAGESIRRLKEKVREITRRGRGRNLRRVIAEELTPLLQGWSQYFRLRTDSKTQADGDEIRLFDCEICMPSAYKAEKSKFYHRRSKETLI